MSKFCPKIQKDVVYLTCQECDLKMCEMDLHPSCESCCHKTGTTNFCGITTVRCALTNAIINENDVKIQGCPNYNKDLSNARICLNCKSFLGGGDWGLACNKHYHKLPKALSVACEDFNKKGDKR